VEATTSRVNTTCEVFRGLDGQLGEPRPADHSVTGQLPSYRRLRKRWTDWSAVVNVLGEVAAKMVSQ
jgi:hypothetical protein